VAHMAGTGVGSGSYGWHRGWQWLIWLAQVMVENLLEVHQRKEKKLALEIKKLSAMVDPSQVELPVLFSVLS
jgi:hypothetical protein